MTFSLFIVNFHIFIASEYQSSTIISYKIVGTFSKNNLIINFFKHSVVFSVVYLTVNQITFLNPFFSIFLFPSTSFCLHFLYSVGKSVPEYMIIFKISNNTETCRLEYGGFFWFPLPLVGCFSVYNDDTSIVTDFSMYFHTYIKFKQKNIHTCDKYIDKLFSGIFL